MTLQREKASGPNRIGSGVAALVCLGALTACQRPTDSATEPKQVQLQVQVPGISDRVRVDLMPIYNPVEVTHNLRAQKDWARREDKPAWRLREYRRARADGGWGYVSYEALGEADLTPMGHRIEFVCQGVPQGEPVQCQGAYRLDAHTYVWYFFHHRWMPQWAEIHAQVLKSVPLASERN